MVPLSTCKQLMVRYFSPNCWQATCSLDLICWFTHVCSLSMCDKDQTLTLHINSDTLSEWQRKLDFWFFCPRFMPALVCSEESTSFAQLLFILTWRQRGGRKAVQQFFKEGRRVQAPRLEICPFPSFLWAKHWTPTCLQEIIKVSYQAFSSQRISASMFCGIT